MRKPALPLILGERLAFMVILSPSPVKWDDLCPACVVQLWEDPMKATAQIANTDWSLGCAPFSAFTQPT